MGTSCANVELCQGDKHRLTVVFHTYKYNLHNPNDSRDIAGLTFAKTSVLGNLNINITNALYGRFI